eukprot:scaffold56_cov379-Prasinococcus_capsulatus_cf.AAC.1
MRRVRSAWWHGYAVEVQRRLDHAPLPATSSCLSLLVGGGSPTACNMQAVFTWLRPRVVAAGSYRGHGGLYPYPIRNARGRTHGRSMT